MKTIRNTFLTLLLLPFITGCSAMMQSLNSAVQSSSNASITGNYSTPRQRSGDGGTVTVQRLPQTVAEFEAMRNSIADRPHGAAACFIIALNMFMENQQVGEECLAMSVAPSQRGNQPGRLASVRQIIYDRYAPENEGSSIYSPWIPHCFFQGFNVHQDWVKPQPPYRMVFGRNPGLDNIFMENSNTFEGYSIPLTVDAFNNTTNPRSRYRNVTAVRPIGSRYYVLSDFDNLISTASYKRAQGRKDTDRQEDAPIYRYEDNKKEKENPWRF